MKKMLSMFLVLVMALSLLAACGGAAAPSAGSTAATPAAGDETPKDPSSPAPDSLKTIGEAMALEADEVQYASYGTDDGYLFIYAFQKDGTYYRAIADMPEKTAEAYWALDFDEEDYDQKVADLVADLKITTFEDLTAGLPEQKDLDALVGKTGQDLLDDGWYCLGYDLSKNEFYMESGVYTYTVVFEGELTATDDFSAEEAIQDLPILSVDLGGIGDATMMEIESD